MTSGAFAPLPLAPLSPWERGDFLALQKRWFSYRFCITKLYFPS